MKIDEIRRRAYSMPLTSPAFPRGPYRFYDREYFIITYRTDPEAIEKILPEPLTFDEPLVKYEFIRMPNSTGFGDYTRVRPGHSRCGSTGNPALTPMRCSSMTARRFTAGANYGVFPRNWANLRSASIRTPWSERSIMGRCASRPA